MTSITIRKATVEDVDCIMQMILELAAHEGCVNGPKITSSNLRRDGFETETPRFYCFIAECSETKNIVGFVMWHYTYSSWHATSIYMENLYVRHEYRRKKVGSRLLKEVCKVAKEEGVRKVDWNVVEKNYLALKFYQLHEAYDVYKVEGRSTYRLFGDKILKVANSPD